MEQPFELREICAQPAQHVCTLCVETDVGRYGRSLEKLNLGIYGRLNTISTLVIRRGFLPVANVVRTPEITMHLVEVEIDAVVGNRWLNAANVATGKRKNAKVLNGFFFILYRKKNSI